MVTLLLVENFLLVDRANADTIHGRRKIQAAARVGPIILVDGPDVIVLLPIIIDMPECNGDLCEV